MSPADELEELVWARLAVLAPLTGLDPDEIADRITARCAAVIVDLLADDPRLAAEACISVMPVAPDDDPAWWRGALGRLVARSLDGDVGLSRSEAAAMLGVTPGTVAQLTARGALERDAEGHVLRSSVLRRIAGRA